MNPYGRYGALVDQLGLVCDRIQPVGPIGRKPTQPAPQAPEPANVVLDVDVYKAPGKGKPIGVLRKGSQVSLIEPCGSNNWCHVGGAAVPNGEGWVYSGPDYWSLTF